jgi:RNA polymerase sigma-70 factor (ECF subfamily)
MIQDSEVKRLLLLTAAKDANAFGQLYRLMSPLLLGISMRILRRRELAEEVLQDVFVKVWNNAGRFDPSTTHPVAWMAAIVRNRSFDVVASADVARVDSFDALDEDGGSGLIERILGSEAVQGESADAAIDRKRSESWLRQCLEGLGNFERQSLVLAYYHGLSHSELADHLEKPLGTIKSWVRRGMAAMKVCIERCMGDA